MPRLFLILLLALVGAVAWPGAGAALAAPSALGDFNGDGRADLAMGVPNEDVGSVLNAGAVNVLYGSAVGLSSSGNQFWHQNSPGINDAAETDDHFGSALAAGDFNGDSYADLAVGAEYEALGDVIRVGVINVLYGSEAGLLASGNQLWHQDSPGIVDAAESGDRFGSALAAGDFNGDARADLAVGVPSEDVGSLQHAGATNVIYGAAGRLVAAGNQFWHQNRPSVLDPSEGSDGFGESLAAGDFNGDARDDLAVGVPFEGVNGESNAGAVNTLYGGASGLSAASNQFWHQDSAGVLGEARFPDNFGRALAAGDFNGDARADLAVGVPGDNPRGGVSGRSDGGAVNVLYGSVDGLSATGNQLWHQDSIGILDAVEQGEFFGAVLAAGDFNGDERVDLAVAVHDESVGTVEDAGAANVLYGVGDGLSATGNQFWHQDSPNVLEVAEQEDLFGGALASGDFNGDTQADLAVGVPFEEVRNITHAAEGAVNVLYGSAGALSAVGNQLWHQASPGVLDAAENGDDLGSALASGAPVAVAG